MEIQELRNLYLNKIITHINKVNNELTIYNQSNVQIGGSSLADLKPILGQPQLKFTPHNKSSIDSIISLKGNIEQLKKNEQKLNDEKLQLEKLYKILEESLNSSKLSSNNQKQEIEKLKQDISKKEYIISELQITKSELTASIKLLSEKNTELNRELENAKKMSEKVIELNSNIEKISKESIKSLFIRSKELIEFYYHSSNDVKGKILELIEEIKNLGKEPKKAYLEQNLQQIYTTYIIESYEASSNTENQYNISTFDTDLNKLQVLLNTMISQAKEINNKLHLQYEEYLTEKDTILAELTKNL
jgi:hypothetical protein